MDKETAKAMMTNIRKMYEPYKQKGTAANVRHIDTSYGKIRVLEYGFDNDDVRPLYVDIHGGGYCVGFPEMDEEINLMIMKSTNVKIISIDWPKAPENPYPIGQEATYEVIRHYYENAAEYKIDRDNIGIGGYSSGGNFATVVPIKAKERSDLKIKYQVLFFPGVDIDTDPYDKKGSDKVLDREFLKAIHACYLSEPEHSKHPYTSPRWAPRDMLVGLPPAFIILAGLDPLYAEGKDYGDKLKEAGVDVEMHNFEDADHGFTYMGNEDDKRKAYELMIDFIRRHSQR
ncbi:MAG: alpha/beta hydrolase fold domain-containing protein [Methanomassiliicoccaceae archaeon]|nr:alpha/beta hydrolase fold domain-containing protein [Methanomassiliicoccaceae archaeon]